MKFNVRQVRLLRSYSLDISKALMLGVILGQAYIPQTSLYIKIYINVFWFSLSILLFVFAMIISGRYE